MKIGYTALNSKRKIKKVDGWGRAWSCFPSQTQRMVSSWTIQKSYLLLDILKSTVDQWPNTTLPGKVREQGRGAE